MNLHELVRPRFGRWIQLAIISTCMGIFIATILPVLWLWQDEAPRTVSPSSSSVPRLMSNAFHYPFKDVIQVRLIANDQTLSSEEIDRLVRAVTPSIKRTLRLRLTSTLHISSVEIKRSYAGWPVRYASTASAMIVTKSVPPNAGQVIKLSSGKNLACIHNRYVSLPTDYDFIPAFLVCMSCSVLLFFIIKTSGDLWRVGRSRCRPGQGIDRCCECSYPIVGLTRCPECGMLCPTHRKSI